jgi:hypothetical protein
MAKIKPLKEIKEELNKLLKKSNWGEVIGLEINFLPEFYNLKKEFKISSDKWEKIPFKVNFIEIGKIDIPFYKFPRGDENEDFGDLRFANLLEKLEFLGKVYKTNKTEVIEKIIEKYLFLTDLKGVEFLIEKNLENFTILPYRLRIPFYKKGELIWELF